MKCRWRILAGLVVVPLAGLFAAVSPTPHARAASAGDFDPSFIISDTAFYDSGTMSAGQIQDFLNTQGRNCVAGDPACLKDYRETTRAWAAESGLCAGYVPASNESAATIIAKVALSCGVNPRVLLVLLEKENSLVTRTRPTTRSYDAATGFGCPDTAPCNTEYFGFFNQVYRAARQYKVYAANPTRYNYQAGRSQFVLYNPNTACGGSQLNIRNQATAGLYIYTPYQPNAAALANLYGAGDGCSAYGNRNFWRLFSDWFGDPQAGSFLVRSVSSPDIFLVVGTVKYPVASWALFTTLKPLGPWGYVSQAYLGGKATARIAMPRVVHDPRDGGIYLLDDGRKYHMPTCEMVAAYGGSCSALVSLTAVQIDAFATNSTVQSVVQTTSGKRFSVEAGTKREVLDNASARAAGVSTSAMSLTEGALESLPYGVPYTREDVLILGRGSTDAWLIQGGRKASIPASIRAETPFGALPAAALEAASIANIPTSTTITGLFANSAQTAEYVITTAGLVPLSDPRAFADVRTPLSAALLGTLPTLAVNDGSVFVKESSSAEVSLLIRNVRRPMAGWDELVLFAGTQAPRILTLPASVLATTTRGTPLLTPGSLVKSDRADEIYMVNGPASMVYVQTFAVAQQFGRSGFRTVTVGTLGPYVVNDAALSPVVTCAGVPYVSVGTYLQQRAPAVLDPEGLPVTALDSVTCRALPTRSSEPRPTGPVFVKAEGSSVIYSIDGATKRPVRDWPGLLALNAGHGTPLIVTLGSAAIAAIPGGPIAP